MDKGIKILIIGFGSIGQRHYHNLAELGYRNVYVYDINKSATESCKLKINNLNSKILKNFDGVFICTPNHEHLKAALKGAQADCHLFIEKPLSHNFKGVNELIEICRKKKLITMVGCNMRFHPCLSFIKNYLAQGKLGNLYSIALEFGYFLPAWRPRQDYRKNYAAKRSTGGGIILDDIHEFDLLFWLNNFQPVDEVDFIFNNSGALRIETEDNCLASFQFKNKVLGLVKCDYLQRSYSRRCKIVGEKGNLEWDFKENIVWLETKAAKRKLFAMKNFDFNQVYVDEVKYFFNCLEKNKPTFNDVKIAASVLKYCVNKQ